MSDIEQVEPTHDVFALAPRNKIAQTLMQIDDTRRLDRQVEGLRQVLGEMKLVASLSQVAQSYPLSAPLAAAFHAVPGFDQAVQNFPDAQLLDLVPAHPTSEHSVAGLESFAVASTSAIDHVRGKAGSVVTALSGVLGAAGTTADNLQVQIGELRTALTESDVTDEVMATASVYALSSTAFTKAFGDIEATLKSITPFNTDDLRAYPNKIENEVAGLSALVRDLGGTVGLTLSEYGLQETDRGADFTPTQGTFSAKGITKAGLAHNLEQASAVLDEIKSLAARKDELIQAASTEVDNLPPTAESSDVELGYGDHARFLISYAMLTTKLVRESFLTVSSLLTAIDAALDVDQALTTTDA